MFMDVYAHGLVFKFINRSNVYLKRIDPFVCLFGSVLGKQCRESSSYRPGSMTR